VLSPFRAFYEGPQRDPKTRQHERTCVTFPTKKCLPRIGTELLVVNYTMMRTTIYNPLHLERPGLLPTTGLHVGSNLSRISFQQQDCMSAVISHSLQLLAMIRTISSLDETSNSFALDGDWKSRAEASFLVGKSEGKIVVFISSTGSWCQVSPTSEPRGSSIRCTRAKHLFLSTGNEYQQLASATFTGDDFIHRPALLFQRIFLLFLVALVFFLVWGESTALGPV
jgi:predicted small integral membrane protein